MKFNLINLISCLNYLSLVALGLFFTWFNLLGNEEIKKINSNNGNLVYHVKSGDNYSSIAKRYNLDFLELYQLNKKKPLHPNDIILVPPYFFHSIKKGDNLYQIAKRYQTTIRNIIEENPTILSKKLFYGRKIKIPFPPDLGFINNFFSKSRKLSLTSKVNSIIYRLSQDPSVANSVANKKSILKDLVVDSFLPEEAKETLRKIKFPLSAQLIKNSSYTIKQDGLMIEMNRPNKEITIRAGYAGEVVYAGNIRGYGKTLIIEAKKGIFIIYLGLKKILAKKDQSVSVRESIAKMDNSLYFYIFYQDIPINLKEIFLKLK